jgi:hypothetical protein
MREPDPTDLLDHERPALVEVRYQGTMFVADASTRENGWVRLRQWDGSHIKLPPHRVLAVQYLETERYGDRDDMGVRSKRLTDEALRSEPEAYRRDGLNDDRDSQQRAVAYGGGTRDA